MHRLYPYPLLQHLSIHLLGSVVRRRFFNRDLVVQEKRDYKSSKTAMLATMGSVANLGGIGIFLHEAGHALLARGCYKNAQPRIQIKPFMGGSTTFSSLGGKTLLGKMLGSKGSLLVIVAGGMTASLVTALAGFSLAERIKEGFPNLSQAIKAFNISQIATEVFYGLGALFSDPMNLSHDFYFLHQIGGIHPLIPIALLIGVPILWAIKIKKTPTKSGL